MKHLVLYYWIKSDKVSLLLNTQNKFHLEVEIEVSWSINGNINPKFPSKSLSQSSLLVLTGSRSEAVSLQLSLSPLQLLGFPVQLLLLPQELGCSCVHCGLTNQTVGIRAVITVQNRSPLFQTKVTTKGEVLCIFQTHRSILYHNQLPVTFSCY